MKVGTMKIGTMKIGIDARYLTHGLMGGVHTYLLNLLPEMMRQGAAHTFLLYGDAKAPFELAGQLPANASLRLMPYSGALSSLQNEWRIMRWMERDGVTVAHYPTNYGLRPRGARTLITLHDALTVMPLAPQLRGTGSRRSLRGTATTIQLTALSTYTVPRADAIVTISHQAAREIWRYLPQVQPRTHVVYHGVPRDMVAVTDPERLRAVRARLELPERFILADALKNPAVVLAAWRTLPEALRAERRIVFFARTPTLLPAVQEAVESGAARLLLRPERADLIALYSMADLFFFPSWIEGFGLPILEAMACGAPVIASDRGSIPEVAGEAALLADAEDAATFGRHLHDLLTDAALRSRMIARGHARAAEFSWERTAQEMLRLYTGHA